jgi:hypothetical protein
MVNNRRKQMPYMDQAKKAQIAAELKKVMPKDWKYTLGVDNHTAIVLNILKAPIDLLAMINKLNAQLAFRRGQPVHVVKEHFQVNEYYLENSFEGETLEIMQKAKAALHSAGYFDHSDSMTDFSHCAYFISINVGKWNKAFEYTGA